MLEIKCDINQQDLKKVDRHFVKKITNFFLKKVDRHFVKSK